MNKGKAYVNETAATFPQVKHIYQNHTMDSTRWNTFPYRDDDIIISTAYKAGTTWMQTIVGNIIFAGRDMPGPIFGMSPWLDMRMFPFDDLVAMLNAQRHRRFMKTHLPLDGLPYREDIKYIFVARDPRDVFMSLWNHHTNHTDEFFEMLNALPDRVGDPMPERPNDIHDYWKDWISRGWFDWENDGYPYWSFFHHAQTWWEYRHLPNICFAHFNDLLKDLNGEFRRIAAFLEIDVAEDHWPSLVHNATFSTVKKNPETVVSEQANMVFKDGAQAFIYKGTNGRWKDVLTQAELAQYDAVKSRAVSPDCAAWLETGGPA